MRQYGGLFIVQGIRFRYFNEGHSPLETPVILRLKLFLGGVPGEGRRARGLECEDDLRDVQRLVRLVLQEYAHVSLVAHGAIGVNLQHKAGYAIAQYGFYTVNLESRTLSTKKELVAKDLFPHLVFSRMQYKLRRWSFFHAMQWRCFIFCNDAISVIF